MCRNNKAPNSTSSPARVNAWEWQCGMCTFVNRPSFDVCEMCGFPRGTRSEDQVLEQAQPGGGSMPSSYGRSVSSQTAGQQILASLKQANVDSTRVRSDAGCEILAALKRGSGQAPTCNAQRIDPSQEILATLKSGSTAKPVPDSSQLLLAALKNGGHFSTQSINRDWLESVDGHSESSQGQPQQKAARKGRNRRGARRIYDQAAAAKGA
mmetsp:Transcript_41891/g.65343  ORF Transcript_41891/g.65343 Transcript_41891/m.65343 type:complete len:210 (-) Transcript_41891:105-734(-)